MRDIRSGTNDKPVCKIWRGYQPEMDRFGRNKRNPYSRLARVPDFFKVAEIRLVHRRLDLGPATSFLFHMICVLENEGDNYRNVGVYLPRDSSYQCYHLPVVNDTYADRIFHTENFAGFPL